MSLNSDLAWVAGIFEGEGSFDFSRGKNHRTAVKISMTDLDVIERVRSIVGGRVTGPYCRPGMKPIWYWRISNTNECLDFVESIYPWLLSRRREQATVILSLERLDKRSVCDKISLGDSTTNGDMWHRRRNEPVCPKCKIARNRYHREARASRHGGKRA